jgi:hypothetical protein
MLAIAGIGALEGLAIQVAGQAPDNERLAERLMLGLLGLSPGA